jgi:4-alpha-glucanotransferase
MHRSSGLLLPVASLPSPTGIGNFGLGARQWIDFLASSGVQIWAILPLLIPDSVGSPYASPSAFAGNWLFIQNEESSRPLLSKRISYSRINRLQRQALGQSWTAFERTASAEERAAFQTFRKKERSWLNDYCLYMAIKDRQGGAPWYRWPAQLRRRDPGALGAFVRRHGHEQDFFAYGQWRFDQQWQELKRYAHSRGVRILGDLPYTVALDSVDVWRHPEYFKIESNGRLRFQIGAPPDVMNALGQAWGMPAFDWTRLEGDGFKWWVERFRRAYSLYDIIRLDHFRGYSGVWEIPAKAKDARAGYWTPVPGDALFRRLRQSFRRLRCIAEDLGLITDEVIAFRERLRFPGMRVLQFGYAEGYPSYHHPRHYARSSVAYTGTHDLPPLASWARTMPRAIVRRALAEAPGPGSLSERLVASAFSSVSHYVIAQAQDIFNLGSKARINTPGTSRGNWSWRLSPRYLNAAHAKRLRALIKKSRRLHE